MAGGNKHATQKTPRRPGPKPGSHKNRISTVRAMEMVRERRTPLDVMLRNMWFWDEAAQVSQQRVEGIITDLEEVKAKGDVNKLLEVMEKAREIFKAHVEYRENAQRCAVDAAPYIHARYQSIMFRPEGADAKVIEVTATLPPTPAERDEDRSYRDGYDDESNVVRIKRGED